VENQVSKYVIGLTGEIATGHDLVSAMLARLGAETIDADALANQVLNQGAPGYQLVVDLIGPQVLNADEQIDRQHLERHLKSNPALQANFRARFYRILNAAVFDLVEDSQQPVVVIKTLSLFQSGLRLQCNAIWITHSSPEVRLNALMKRGLSREQALHRLSAQASRDNELRYADYIFEHTGSRGELWKQVASAWDSLWVNEGRTVPSRTSQLLFQRPLTAVSSQEAKKNKLRVSKNAEPAQVSQTELRLIGRRLRNIFATLIIIAYLTSYGLIMAERGREHLPAQPVQAAWQAVVSTVEFIFQHPGTYLWNKQDLPAFSLVAETLKASASLLLLALGVALILGMPLGIAAAISKRKASSIPMLLISILGVSMPSFLFGMLLWGVNIWAHKQFNLKVLPSAGFGWDAHLLMPTLVLAMRPLAQIAQITYLSMSEVLRQDYIRTAQAKGLSWRMVRDRHAIPNLLIPTLTTLGASLRYSLASLPVVETFFEWPGVGLTLIKAIDLGNAALVTDLILSLGLFFLIVNLAIELLFPLIDSRLRMENETGEIDERQSFAGWIQSVLEVLKSWTHALRQKLTTRTETLPPLPSVLTGVQVDQGRPVIARWKWILKNILANPSLMIGCLFLLGILGLVFFGPGLTKTSPYQVFGVMKVEGKIGSPPYAPSQTFPWGTDYIGRDIQALVLAGASRTMTLVFLGMLFRMLLGGLLGALAGWQRGGWLDRLVSGAVGVWAAFPITLFAMLLIQALGIQQGMWVFIVAISVVGWGEVAQFVRGQVIGLKLQPFVESARSAGARPDQILIRHILPNLVNALIVLATLEMGGVLMLLAELGFLNIYMGGGFKVMIAEYGAMVPVIAYFSDVPEWAALIANVREWWRSYPWMALFPGGAIFLTIMSFNLLGEGIRRFLEDSQANLSRLFNRYTFIGAAALGVIVSLVLQSTTPLGRYQPEGLKFDSQPVLQDIGHLTELQMQGREAGTAGAGLAASYIAERMEQIGIFPAGKQGEYLLAKPTQRLHLLDLPQLAVIDSNGQPQEQLRYRQDFAELVRIKGYGDAQAPVIGVAFGPTIDEALADPFKMINSAALDRVVIVRAADVGKVDRRTVDGVLVITDENLLMERRDLYPDDFSYRKETCPYLKISPEVADRLLRTAGSSLEQFDKARATLKVGELFLTEAGAQVKISLQPRYNEDIAANQYINVLGVIPGQGQLMGAGNQAIIVSAYYDGLGLGPDGVPYPGANDNASGVAMLLELARLFKESAYQPDKSIIFVAWAGGERTEGLSVVDVLNARPGGNQLNIESVIELSGVGYGTGNSIALSEGSSYRLVKLFQQAAGKYHLGVTTRGRSPHYGSETRPGFGNHPGMVLSISWDGADHLAHTPAATLERIDPQKLDDIGRATYLTLLVLSRESEY